MASKTSSKGQKEQYGKYKSEHRWEKNKLRKMQKHAKNHPNDTVTLKKLEHMNFKYCRRTPGEHKPPEAKKIKCFSERKFIPESIQKQINDIWVWNVS
jgi:hypothetical protein